MLSPSFHRLVSIVALFGLASFHEAAATGLIPEPVARRHGLKRVWFAQIEVNRSKHVVESATLKGHQLVCLTSAGVVQALDARTGQTEWTTRVGNPDYATLGPAIGGGSVAVVNGSGVYVLDRETGREMLYRRTQGGVGGGPGLADDFVFVPLFNGRVEAFHLTDRTVPPWYSSSSGRIFTSVVSGLHSAIWSNDRGHTYVADPASRTVRYRIETVAPVAAPATSLSSQVFVATTGGSVHAVEESTGVAIWRYAAGFSVVASPVAIGDDLYIETQEPALHALDIPTGKVRWVAPGVGQIIGVSEHRVYGLDPYGDLLVLDRSQGVIRSRAVTRGENHAVLNDQNDRLYIYSPDGLVQCFREINAKEPTLHRPMDALEPPTDEDAKQETPSTEPSESTPESTDEPAEDPFGSSDESPAEEADEEDDPFAGDDPFGDF